MLALAALLLSSTDAHAWSQHYLLMDRALDHASVDWADQTVLVEPLEDLLADAPLAMATAVAQHQAWLQEEGSERFLPQELPTPRPTRADFLAATRLNPGVHFPLVLRVPPGQSSAGFSARPEVASSYLHALPGQAADVRVVHAGQLVSAREVLRTYVDEPDWGFDHELWGYEQYGYGTQPYGKAQGESSKAPFHMQFDHENFLTKAFTDLEEGMVPERIDLFLRLSRAAFDSGHPYWGLRFAAWASHYAQDLCQPYHAKAIPGVGFGWYLGYVLSPHKDQISTERTQLEANRHFIYEDFVAVTLQRSYTESNATSNATPNATPNAAPDLTATALAATLSQGPATLPKVSGVDSLVATITKESAHHGRKLEHTLVDAFPVRDMQDPGYDVETAKDYDITALIAGLTPTQAQQVLQGTGVDFEETGEATRTVLAMAHVAAALGGGE